MSVIKQSKIIDSVKVLLDQMPNDWLRLTTHRLDIYVEKLAKTEFLEQLESLVDANNITSASLGTLPTAFDYIRLGHPLSCLLEWSLAKINHLSADKMISFSSKTAPILSVLRKNLFENKKTLISYKGQLPEAFIAANIKAIYGYQFELLEVEDINAIPSALHPLASITVTLYDPDVKLLAVAVKSPVDHSYKYGAEPPDITSTVADPSAAPGLLSAVLDVDITNSN